MDKNPFFPSFCWEDFLWLTVGAGSETQITGPAQFPQTQFPYSWGVIHVNAKHFFRTFWGSGSATEKHVCNTKKIKI